MCDDVKVLIVVGRMHYGGIETMLINFFRNIDRTKVKFDFMLNYQEAGVFDEEIIALGGKIYIMPRLFFKNLLKYTFAVNKFFKEHKGEYDVVHGNLTSVGIIYLTIARLYGVKTKIIHAHSANVQSGFKGFIEKIMIFPVRFCADYYFACSNAAGKYCFGNSIINKQNYKLIKNGINVNDFKFDDNIRELKRKELNVQDRFVVANIGRFENEKNHKFLIEVFKDVYEKDKTAILILIGTGSLIDEIKKLVDKYNLIDAVVFLNVRSDIKEIMQAIDVFVLPSLYEGLPVVGVEAQASGLKCIFSDSITKETNITGLIDYLPIDKGTKQWTDKILDSKNIKRQDMSDKIIDAGYDIVTQTKWLENFYIENSK